MKDFNTILQDKKIVMLSDWVDPKEYHPKELANEKTFISKITNEIGEYGVKFDYIEVANFEELNKLLDSLDNKETIIFNWCEQIDGIPNSGITVVRELEKRGFIFSGANSECLIICEDKTKTKDVLKKNNINVAGDRIVTTISQLDNIDIVFPVIVKYSNMHSSVGISKDNVVYNSKDLKSVVERLLASNKGKILIEEYIAGEEYSVPVWGNDDNVQMLTPTWIKYLDSRVGIIQTEESKFGLDSDEHNNIESIPLDPNQDSEVVDIIRKEVLPAYKCLGFRDYGRFEVRIDNDKVYIIDANPNPALDIETSLITAAQKLGYNIGEFVLQICSFAIKRQVV